MKYKGIYFNLFSLFLKKPMIKKFGKDKTKESLQKGRILYRKMLEKTEDIGEKRNYPALPAIFAEQPRIEVLQYLRIVAVPLNLPSDNAELIQLLRGKRLRILV